MFLIIWDKLFGTFQPELTDTEYQPVKYGLTKPLEKETPTHIVFHEWNLILQDMKRSDISWKEKIFYLFGPPGWSHDGTRLTSEQLRAQEVANNTEKSHQTDLTFPEENLAPITTSIKQ